jgi:O-antigen ligase
LFLVITIQRRRSPISPVLKWFYLWVGLYMFWLILSSQIGHPGSAFPRIGRELLLFLLVPTGIWVFQSVCAARMPIYTFAFGVVLLSLYSIGQFFWGWTFLKPDMLIERGEYGYYISGNLGFAVIFGIYYATAGLFLFGYGLKSGGQRPDWSNRFFIVSGLLSMGVAVLSNERGPTMAVLLTLISLALLLRSRRAFIGIGIALLLMIAVGIQSGVFVRSWELKSKELSMQHDRSRLFIWTYSLRVALNNPIFGVGPGLMKEGYAKVVPVDIPDVTIQVHAHNDFLTVAAESGFPAALFFLALWMTVLGCCFQAQRTTLLSADERGLALGALAGSFCFFITSLFDIPFGHTTTHQMLMIVWAAGLGMYVKMHLTGSKPETGRA